MCSTIIMIEIIFDFNNGIATYREDYETFVRKIEIKDKTNHWKHASFAFMTADGRRMSAVWKIWQEHVQIVQVDELETEWIELAKWSYIEHPKDSESQEVVGSHDGFTITVIGSGFGDWMTL